MQQEHRHQCLIYEGAPSVHLATLARLIDQKLNENTRCLYLNSPPMVAGLRSYLAARGVDVSKHLLGAGLVLSSHKGHLVNGRFDIDRMLRMLTDAVDQALNDGYHGLWASGDMTWEFGPENDFSKLIEYERRLEQLFHQHASLSAVCQYHTDTLPRETVRQGLMTHRATFINETLFRLNPHYIETGPLEGHHIDHAGIDTTIAALCNVH